MITWQREFVRWINYLLEMTILFIFLFPSFLIINHEPPFILFFITILVGAIVNILLYRFTKLTNPWLFLLLSLFAFSMMFGWNLVYATIIAIVLTWRLNILSIKHHPGYEFLKSLITIILGLIVFISLSNYDEVGILIPIIILHFTFTSFVKIADNIFQSDGDQKQKVQDIIKFGTIHIFLAIAIFSVKFLFPFIEFLLRHLLQWITYLVGIIATPFIQFFLWLISLLENEPDSTELEVEMGDVERGSFEFQSLDSRVVMIIIGSLILLFIIYLLLRKRKGNPNTFIAEEIVQTSETKTNPYGNPFKRSVRSRNTIRRLLFRLEKSLAKSGNGRRVNQTVEDWIMGLSSDDESFNHIVIEQYQKVRYGELTCSHDEISQYKHAVESLKKMNS